MSSKYQILMREQTHNNHPELQPQGQVFLFLPFFLSFSEHFEQQERLRE